jgi:hypothetical protein
MMPDGKLICPFSQKECDADNCGIGLVVEHGHDEEVPKCAFVLTAECLNDIASQNAEALATDECEDDCDCPACTTMTEDDDHHLNNGKEDN